jgi:hypothetical protein
MRTSLFLLAIFGLFGIFCATFQVYGPNMIRPGAGFNVTGYVLNSTGGGVNNTNVTANISGIVNYGVTNESGYFNFNLTAPAANGTHSILFSNNYSTETKTLPIYVTNATNVTVIFVGSPTFASGSEFSVNITLKNSSGSAVANHRPEVKIFKQNGNEQNWTITNLSAASSADGSILFNISIPSNAASGPYTVVAEHGAGFAFFYVQSNVQLVAKTKICDLGDTCEDTSEFYPGETVTIEAKLRYLNYTVITGQSLDATITLANGSSSSLTLSEIGNGVYEANYTSPLTLAGTVDVEVSSTVNGAVVRSSLRFSLNIVDVALVPPSSSEAGSKDLKEFGNFKGARPGDTITYNVLVGNESSGELYTVALNGGAGNVVNCSAIQLVDFVRTQNSTSYNSTVAPTFGRLTTTSFGSTVCAVNITVPSTTGVYKWSIIVPFNGSEYATSAYVPVQQYILRVSTRSNIGGAGMGQGEFQQMFRPGSNVTFNVEAYDINGTQVPAANISLVNATFLFNLPTGTKLLPSSGFTVTNTTEGSGGNSVTITLPTSYTDAFVFEAHATVYNTSEVSGNTFFFSKYVVGFLSPSMPQQGGQQSGPGSMSAPESSCTGVETFRGDVMLADTYERLSGVILHARPTIMMNEMSGKDLSHCLSFTPTTSINTSPSIITNVTFNSSCSLSGDHFMLANITFVDESNVEHTDSLPAFFKCARLVTSINVKDMLGSDRVASNAEINVTITNIKYINGTNVSSGTVSVLGAMLQEFGSMTPPSTISVRSGHNLNFSITNGTAQFILYTQNFSLPSNKWSNTQGFVDFKFRVCSGSICEVSTKGIMIGSNLHVWFTDPPSQQLVPGTNLTVSINAATNVSTIVAVFENSGFFGSTPASLSKALLFDGWNSTADDTSPTGYERWEVNVTIPSSLSKGSTKLVFTINSSASGTVGEKATLSTFGSVQGVTIGMADASMQLESGELRPSNSSNNQTLLDNGWNISFIKTNLSGFADMNESLSVCFSNNITIRTYGQIGSSQILIDPAISVLLLAKNGTGSQDTLLLRNTSVPNNSTNASAFTVVNLTNRSFGVGRLYLWDIYGCSYIKVVNANASVSSFNNFGGDYSTNSNFVLPYILRQGNSTTPITSGVTVNISNVYKETDMGFGLGTPFTNYFVTASEPDANGVAFVTMNISQSGRYKLFWKVNGSINETASASSMFMGPGSVGSSGPTPVQIRKFRMQADWLEDTLAYSVFNISNASAGAWPFLGFGDSGEIFNGSISNFMNNGSTLYLGFNTTNNETRMNWTAFSSLSTCTLAPCTRTDRHTFGSSVSVAISGLRDLDSATKTVSLYKYEPLPSNSWCKKVNSPTETVFLRFCVFGFEASNPTPYNGANISGLIVQAGQVQTPVFMYDPTNSSQISSIHTTASGCTAIRVNTTAWPPYGGSLMANITYQGNTETVFTISIGQNQYCSNW